MWMIEKFELITTCGRNICSRTTLPTLDAYFPYIRASNRSKCTTIAHLWLSPNNIEGLVYLVDQWEEVYISVCARVCFRLLHFWLKIWNQLHYSKKKSWNVVLLLSFGNKAKWKMKHPSEKPDQDLNSGVPVHDQLPYLLGHEGTFPLP